MPGKPIRTPLLAFATLAVVVVGFTVYASRSTRDTVDRMARVQADWIAALIGDLARRHDELAREAVFQLDRSDALVLEMLAALVEEADLARLRERSPHAAILGRFLKSLTLDRALLVDRTGAPLLDVRRPARPGKLEPSPIERLEDHRVLEAAAAVAAGGPHPRDEARLDPFRLSVRKRLFRRVGDRLCLVLERNDATLERLRPRVGLRRALGELASDPAVAWLRVSDGNGADVAAAGDRAAATGESGIHTATHRFEVGGRELTLEVGLRLDRETLLTRERARWMPWLVGAALLLAGGVAMAFVFRQQHLFWRRERELRARAERERRLGALGSLTAGVAHEIKNPLNTIRLSAGRLERRCGEEQRPMLEAIGDAVGAISRTVEDFVKLARAPGVALRPEDPAGVLREAVQQATPMAGELDRTLHLEADGGPPLPIDRARLREALVNLLRNALQFAAARVEVRLRRVAGVDGVRITVDDDGPGVLPTSRAQVFELFFSGREGGTGLGLPLALRVAEEHGGTLEVSEAPLGGARFTLTLPGGPTR